MPGMRLPRRVPTGCAARRARAAGMDFEGGSNLKNIHKANISLASLHSTDRRDAEEASGWVT